MGRRAAHKYITDARYYFSETTELKICTVLGNGFIKPHVRRSTLQCNCAFSEEQMAQKTKMDESPMAAVLVHTVVVEVGPPGVLSAQVRRIWTGHAHQYGWHDRANL